MIRYLKSVIKCSVNLAIENLEDLRTRLQSFSAKNSESNSIFILQLHCDSNAIAFKQQMHSKKHSHICFKNVKNESQECRFLFLCKLIADTHVNQHEVIQLKQNNH